MNFGQLYAGLLMIVSLAASWIPFETAFNPGLLFIAGLGLYYLARIDDRLENIEHSSAKGDAE